MNKTGIAIDGPAGAGKSTIVKLVANELQIGSVDTGAFYRTIAYALKQKNINVNDFDKMADDEVEKLMQEIDLYPVYREGKQYVVLNGEELVDDVLRTEDISMSASTVSKKMIVRNKVTEISKKVASENEVIMEGRDITTVIMPDAKLKIFLDASPEERATRRKMQLEEKGQSNVDYNEILEDLIKRDRQDSENENSPFSKAKNNSECIILDSTNLSIEEVVQRIVGEYRNR